MQPAEPARLTCAQEAYASVERTSDSLPRLLTSWVIKIGRHQLSSPYWRKRRQISYEISNLLDVIIARGRTAAAGSGCGDADEGLNTKTELTAAVNGGPSMVAY